MMRALICGGSGFIGSHVADALVEAGHSVRIFDLAQTNYIRSGQEMVVGDILNAEAVARAAQGCDYVYNLAGIAHLDDSIDAPMLTAQLNIIGNLNALEAARKAGAKRFVYASSAYVYSRGGSFYRVSKQASEGFVEEYFTRYALPFTILRYGSLYGRRSNAKNGIYRMLDQAVRERAISYGGNGDAMREYIHVTDAAKLSVKVLEAEFENRHITLSGTERMPVRMMMQMIAEMMPSGLALSWGSVQREGHYEVTPYAFTVRPGHKLVATDYVELGQGILDCLAEHHDRLEQ
jgi:UDP-glucose 4-epimerase